MDLNLCIYHNSPLKPTKISLKCVGCYEDHHHENKLGYKCDLCDFYIHEECISPNIPSRHKHPLKFGQLDNYIWCRLCGVFNGSFYHCSLCSFLICIRCLRKPLMIQGFKAHEHELQQISIKLSFTCDACGEVSTNYPCICHQCCFIIHRLCISLPRVIYINHHDHRISHVYSLGPGKWTCGVCLEPVNGECGAYSCTVCSYVAHSKCATNRHFWDGMELEGKPEKEESKPFEAIGQNLIKHFSHEHNLMKIYALPYEEGSKHCYACTLPLDSESCYDCTLCDFILHDACANLPPKKRSVLTPEKLTLSPEGDTRFYQTGGYIRNHLFCTSCRRYCNGFSYNDSYQSIDVRCASISIPFKHKSHPHWLFLLMDGKNMRCEGCCGLSGWFLRCNGKDACGGFKLCFGCATLPTSVKFKYDDHPLSLYYGDKNGISTYWCGKCEEEIDSKNWFYKCDDCCSTLHTKCAFGNLAFSRPGNKLIVGDMMQFNFLQNNRLSRPICLSCKTRCADDLFLNDKDQYGTKKSLCYSCSFKFYHGILPYL